MTEDGSEKRWTEHLHEASVRAEAELRRLIQYINDEVVPEVRRDGSAALRRAATELERLAEQVEGRPPRPGPPSQ